MKYWVELAADYGAWHEAETPAEAAGQVFKAVYDQTAGAKMILTYTGPDYAENWTVYGYDEDDGPLDDIFVWDEEKLAKHHERGRAMASVSLAYKA